MLILKIIAFSVTYIYAGMIVAAWYKKSGRGETDKHAQIKTLRLVIFTWPLVIIFVLLDCIGDVFYSLASWVWGISEDKEGE